MWPQSLAPQTIRRFNMNTTRDMRQTTSNNNDKMEWKTEMPFNWLHAFVQSAWVTAAHFRIAENKLLRIIANTQFIWSRKCSRGHGFVRQRSSLSAPYEIFGYFKISAESDKTQIEFKNVCSSSWKRANLLDLIKMVWFNWNNSGFIFYIANTRTKSAFVRTNTGIFG